MDKALATLCFNPISVVVRQPSKANHVRHLTTSKDRSLIFFPLGNLDDVQAANYCGAFMSDLSDENGGAQGVAKLMAAVQRDVS